MKKFLLKGLFIVVFIHVMSIFSCLENCEQQYFRVLDIFLENAKRTNSTYFNIDEVPEDNAVKYNEYSIALVNGVEYYTSHFHFKNPFITSLAACNTVPESGEKVTNILIWSNADFIKEDGDVIPAGEYLNNSFLIDYRDNKEIPIAEFLQSDENTTFETVVFLSLDEVPANKQAHRFFVRYELDSDNSFAGSTSRVYIEP